MSRKSFRLPCISDLRPRSNKAISESLPSVARRIASVSRVSATAVQAESIIVMNTGLPFLRKYSCASVIPYDLTSSRHHTVSKKGISRRPLYVCIRVLGSSDHLALTPTGSAETISEFYRSGEYGRKKLVAVYTIKAFEPAQIDLSCTSIEQHQGVECLRLRAGG